MTVFWRFALAAPLLLAACRLWGRKEPRFEWRDLPKIAGLSAVGIFLMSNLSFYAVRYTTNINVTIIMTASAVLIGLIAFLGGTKVTKRQWVAIATGLLGVGFITIAMNRHERDFSVWAHMGGVGLATLGSLSWAVYTVYGGPMVAKYGGLRTTAWAIWIGVIMQAPVALLGGAGQAPKGGDWAVLVYLGVVPTALAFTTWFMALKYVDVTTLGMTQYVGPILNATLAWLLLGERILWMHVAGAALIFAGLHFASRPTYRGGENSGNL